VLNLSPLYGIIIDGNKISDFVSKQKRSGKGKWLDISLFTGFPMPAACRKIYVEILCGL